VQPTVYRRRRFPQRYTRADVELLAVVDEAHETLSDPATRRILELEVQLYGNEQYARLARIITYAEEAVIRDIIRRRCAMHEPEFTLALETGMRRGELYALEWDRVDFERRQLLLLKTKNGTARVVILTAAAVSALEQLWKCRNPDSPKVCLTRYGEPMISPCAWFELVMGEAIKNHPSLKDVTWHIFRHTYISRLVMAGVDLRTVQELAGHKDIKMTTRYAHLASAHKLAAVDRLAEYRKEQEKAEARETTRLSLVSA
jgi:integrase